MADIDRDGSRPEGLTRSERPSAPKLAPTEASGGPLKVGDPTGPGPAVQACPACHATNAPGVTICSACGESLAPDPLLGKVVDERYEVVRRLGAGAMGAVYEVRHLRLSKRFAMKVIHRELSQVSEFVARFEREALSTSRLQHPNCILVTDFGHAQTGELYLVMEFLEGQPLTNALDKPLPVGTALEITRQVLLGVQHAHEAGVIHRDLKPDNVVRMEKSDGSWEIKVVDFGIAKLPFGGTDKEPLTKAGVVFGTPQYMAPEQALGGEIGPQTDIYAVGAMLWRMITGRHVFEAEGHMEVLSAKLSGPAPSLDKVAPGVFSPSVRMLLQRCLERNPSERLPSAKEMLDAIDKILAEPGGGLGGAAAGAESKPSTGEGFGTVARRLITAAGSTARTSGRGLATLVSGWYRCEGLAPEPTWKVRAQSLVTTSRGIGVLVLLVALLGLLVVVPVILFGGEDSNAKGVAQRRGGIGGGAGKGVSPRRIAGVSGKSSSQVPRKGTVGIGTAQAPMRPAFERAQAFLARGACREAAVEAQTGLSEEPTSARGRYLLGAALYCNRMIREGLSAYAAAVALDPSFKRDPRLLDDAERALRSERYRDQAFDFLEQKIGDAALPVFIKLASNGTKGTIRHRAVAIVTRLGAGNKIDWVSSLALDLKQLRSCKDRATVVEQLRQLKDIRAIPVLREARDERSGWFGMRMKHHCIRKQITAALVELYELPGAAPYR